MRIRLIGLLLIMCLSCAPQAGKYPRQDWFSSNGKVKVLTTIAMIDDIVKRVGGEHIDSLPLIKGELDPHSYQLVKGDDEKLGSAHLIFYNGLGLEHGPSLQQYLYQNPKAIGLGNLLLKQNPELILEEKGQIDPHIWMDISLWSQTVPTIVKELSRVDPEHRKEFELNGEMLVRDMLLAHQTAFETLQNVPQEQRYLVTSHDAFNYFTRAYLAEKDELAHEQWRPRFAAPEGLAPESQLSATDIQNIIEHVKRYQVHVIFPESNVSKDSLRKIVQAAREKGLQIRIADKNLYADAMGDPGTDGDTYLKMIQHNAKTIADNLKDSL